MAAIPGRASSCHEVFVGLGSNLSHPELGEPSAIIASALRRLADEPALVLTHWSSLYRSAPLFAPDDPELSAESPDYINAVCRLSTSLEPLQLLQRLQAIELEFRRTRSGRRWSSRTLDLDILRYEDLVVDTAQLILPHYAMLERNFVLVPLLEIAPALTHIDGSELASHTAALDWSGLERINRLTVADLRRSDDRQDPQDLDRGTHE